MSWVWRHSQSRPVERLLLLAIADCANAEGAEAWPSVDELKRKTGMSKRNVYNATKALVELGELAVDKTVISGRQRNRYRVVMGEPDAPKRGERRAPHKGATPSPEGDAPVKDVHRSGAPGSHLGAPGAPGVLYTNHPEPSSNRPSSELALREERADVDRLCEHLADRIEQNGSNRPNIGKRWRDAARLMLDRDGREEAAIHRAIDWCQGDEFWRTNILSMPKLREKYEQLRLKAQAERNGHNGAQGHLSTADQRALQAVSVGDQYREKGQ